jgi:hypothetical protein
MKLTDTQLVLLSAASQREDRGIELAPELRGEAAQKLVRKLLAECLIEEVHATGSLPVWRRDADNQALALRITELGLAAIKVDEGAAPPGAEESHQTEQLSRRVGAARRKNLRAQASRSRITRRDTKQSRVIEMLHRRQGATIATIIKATGWQSHAVRGFFAGVVRNKLGLTLVSEKTGKERIYRIVAGKATTTRKGKPGRKTA